MDDMTNKELLTRGSQCVLFLSHHLQDYQHSLIGISQNSTTLTEEDCIQALGGVYQMAEGLLNLLESHDAISDRVELRLADTLDLIRDRLGHTKAEQTDGRGRTHTAL